LVLGRAANQGIAQFIYDSSTGRLLFDADGTGSGASTQIAILTTNPVLGTSSFTVIA
jgi:Ca2+-binding RTX toxin-like protein